MALTKITKINTKVNVVEGLETRPQMPPQTLKQKFDEDSVNLKADVNGVVDGVNAVIDELTSTNGAKNIGTAKIDGVVGGNVQDVMQGLIPKTDIVQALGSATDKLISQKAVTDAIGQKGGGDMLKAVYDTTNNGVVDDAEKLGGKQPTFYAKKTEVEAAQKTADVAVCASATPRGYSMSDANGMNDGWALC
ncbi:MAG: hypothetical protein RSC60_07280, partial [Christensenellaceae bacterium]